ARAMRDDCDWKARSTSSRKATSCTSASTSEHVQVLRLQCFAVALDVHEELGGERFARVTHVGLEGEVVLAAGKEAGAKPRTLQALGLAGTEGAVADGRRQRELVTPPG